MSTESGPLSTSFDLSGTKTTVPLIADNTWCKLRLEKVSEKSVPDKGNVLNFEYAIVDPVPSSDGGIIQPGAMGSKIFDSIQLYARPDAKNPKWFLEKLAKRMDALLGTGDEGNKAGKPTRPGWGPELAPSLIGCVIVAKMKVKTGEYTGNEIAEAVCLADAPSA